MANLNKVMLIGNVTRDPEIKYTPKGSAVTDLGIAVNRVYTPEGGEKREETTFVDVTLWGRQAEIAGEYCKKGRSIYIEGRLQLDSWEDKTSGQKRSKLRVVGENFQLLVPVPAVEEVTPVAMRNIPNALRVVNPPAARVVVASAGEATRLPSLRSKRTTFLFEPFRLDSKKEGPGYPGPFSWVLRNQRDFLTEENGWLTGLSRLRRELQKRLRPKGERLRAGGRTAFSSRQKRVADGTRTRNSRYHKPELCH